MNAPIITELPAKNSNFPELYTAEMAASYEAHLRRMDAGGNEDKQKAITESLAILSDIELLPEQNFLRVTDNVSIVRYKGIRKSFFQRYQTTPSSMTGAWFITLYRLSLDEYQSTAKPSEIALLSLLEANVGLPEIGQFDFSQEAAGEIFHKQFRQADIVPASGVDWAIWNLLTDAPIFWKTLELGRVLDVFEEDL